MNNELKMAMMLASPTWPGTSLTEGAIEILNEIYGPHDHTFFEDHEGRKRCTRCGAESN